MKIFGKQGDNYIVSIKQDELLQIIFGIKYPTYNDKIKKDVYEFIDRINKEEVEVQASKIFCNVMGLAETEIREGYGSIQAKLDAISGLLTPVQKFIDKIKDKTKDNA